MKKTNLLGEASAAREDLQKPRTVLTNELWVIRHIFPAVPTWIRDLLTTQRVRQWLCQTLVTKVRVLPRPLARRRGQALRTGPSERSVVAMVGVALATLHTGMLVFALVTEATTT